MKMDQVLCYLCPLCPSEFTSYSLQRTLETLNQHISRRHGREARIVSVENLRRLMCVPTGLNGSYICAQTPTPDVSTNFRCRSLFEQRSLILEETMAENETKITQSEMLSFYPAPKNHSFVKECIEMLLEGERLSRHSWVDFLRHQMALDEKGSASSRAWVPVHTFSSIQHYASTMAAFAFFCQSVDPIEFPKTIKMCDLFFKALTEPKKLLKYQFIARRFMNFSYLSMGRGVRSKQPVFVTQEAVALLYAFKVAYLIFATKLPNVQASVENAVSIAQRFLNQASDAETSFKSIKRIKNQAKSCIAAWSTSPITWVRGTEYSSLMVDTGKGKYTVSHFLLMKTYLKLIADSSAKFDLLKIPNLSQEEFLLLRDPTSICPNEGLASFNVSLFPLPAQNALFDNIILQDKLPEFLTECSILGLTLMCAMHITGGPGARAAEECFFTVKNTSSCTRHIKMLGSVMVVVCDYCKQRKMTYKQPMLVVKFLTQALGVYIARYVIFVKEMEARVVAHLTKNSLDAEVTRTFFCTTFGKNYDPAKFPSLLADIFDNAGLELNLHDFRHVLEAFARKLPKSLKTSLTLLKTANHSASTSSSYGRSDEDAEFIDADICEEDQNMCELWNSEILKVDQDYGQETTAKKKGKIQIDVLPEVLDFELQQGSSQSFVSAPIPLTPVQESVCQAMLGGAPKPAPPLDFEQRVSKLSVPLPISLRPMQEKACQFLSSKPLQSSILILPTGAGKTMIIQAMRHQSKCDIVLSPYALLTHQLATVLGGARYPCMPCHSDAYVAANASCIICPLDIVQVNSPLVGMVQMLVSLGRLGTIWIDEAHCLITRGAFRPKFAEVWTFAAQLAKLNIHPR